MEDKTPRYSIAIDLGTTTIGLSLVEVEAKEVVAREFVENPQRRWGADILSRLSAIEREPSLLKAMQQATVEVCQNAIKGLLDKAGVEEGLLAKIHCAGNPVMEHIFLGISPLSIARVPYKPAFRKAKRAGVAECGFDLPHHVVVYTFPLVSGFVGGDAVASFFALPDVDGVILIDIGTNSEIILSFGNDIYATSAPAGSVFEGGDISCGMAPVEGAIERVEITEEGVKVETIGGRRPAGLTGSAFAETVAGLISNGIIDSSGRIKEPDEIYTNLASRVKSIGGKKAFVLYRDAKGELSVIQDDVRLFQLAKASIRAGTEILLKRAGLEKTAINKVYVTGSFGVRLSKEVLTKTGIVGKEFFGKIEFFRDGALRGVERSLLEENGACRVEALAESIKYVPLSGTRAFEKEFTREINF